MDTKILDAVMRQVVPNSKTLKTGRVLAIDPASVKSGWAYFEAGKLVSSGAIHIKHRWPHHRLRLLATEIQKLPAADLIITEKIGPWNKKTVPGPYISLLKSIGVIVANTTWKYCLEISPSVWQYIAGDRWSKTTDENDAITIGEVAIRLATTGIEVDKAS